MKKAIALVLILALTLSLTGCGSKPEAAIDKFFDAVKTFDSEAMTEALAPSGVDNLGESSQYFEATDDPFNIPIVDYLKGNAAKITYEVTATTVDGDEATVTVKCKYVDGSQLFAKVIQEMYKIILSNAFSQGEMTEEEIMLAMTDLLQKNLSITTETFTEKTIDMSCVKVDGTWYVSTVSDEMVDVISSNLFTAAKGLAETFGQ